MAKKKELKIEDRLQEIEQIVAKLESDETGLEDAMQAFEVGVRLIRETQKILLESEQKVQLLLEENDEMVVESLDDEDVV
ncbi:MAG: exodeoxyribonuclease VII small subunit [Pseudomonadota bacterium]